MKRPDTYEAIMRDEAARLRRIADGEHHYRHARDLAARQAARIEADLSMRVTRAMMGVPGDTAPAD